jgi:hypothetical protein
LAGAKVLAVVCLGTLGETLSSVGNPASKP